MGRIRKTFIIFLRLRRKKSSLSVPLVFIMAALLLSVTLKRVSATITSHSDFSNIKLGGNVDEGGSSLESKLAGHGLSNEDGLLDKKLKNEKSSSSQPHSSFGDPPPLLGPSIIVCGVDGTVYTMNAESGMLRGLFTSGSELVSSSTMMDQEQNDHEHNGEFMPQHGDASSSTSESRQYSSSCPASPTLWEKIVPGLDGQIYSLGPSLEDQNNNDHNFDFHADADVHLTVLPINVLDVTDQPVRTCHRTRPCRDRKSSSDQAETKHDTIFVNNYEDDRGSDGTASSSVNEEVDEVFIFSSCNEDDNREACQQDAERSDRDDPYYDTQHPVLIQGDERHDSDHSSGGSTETCGIVMGEKRSKLFAVNIRTGSVEWVHSHGQRHSATAGPGSHFQHAAEQARRKHSNQKDSIVLLQREDYVVRHVDDISGQETWNVTVGNFHALDFPEDRPKRTSSHSVSLMAQQQSSTNFKVSTGKSAARASPVQGVDRNPWTMSGLPNSGSSNFISEGKGKKKSRDTMRAPLPFVAFSDDGRQIIAVDAHSRKVLWKRRLPSVIAAVYGVGSKNSWTTITVVDDDDIILQETDDASATQHEDLHDIDESNVAVGKYQLQRQQQLVDESFPSVDFDYTAVLFGPKGGFDADPAGMSLMPYISGSGGAKEQHPLRISRTGSKHSSSLFVMSKARRLPTPSAPAILEERFFSFPRNNLPGSSTSKRFQRGELLALESGAEGRRYEEKMTFTNTNADQDFTFIGPSWAVPTYGKFHKTEHGLFLTWAGVSSVIVLFLMLIVLARYGYLRQKRKWTGHQSSFSRILSPANGSTTAMAASSSNNANEVRPLESPKRQLSLDRNHAKNKTNDLPTPISNSTLRTSSPSRSSLLVSRPPRTARRTRSLPMIASPRAQSFDELKEKFFKQNFSTTFLNGSHLKAQSSRHHKYDEDGGDDDSDNCSSSTADSLRLSTKVSRSQHNGGNSGDKQDSAAGQTRQRSSSVPEAPAAAASIDGIPLVRYSRYKSEFREISALGKGGFGTVFKCENVLDGRAYAVKKIRIKSFVDHRGLPTKHLSAQLKRVLREVKILARLDHPNIVRYYTSWLELDNESSGPEKRAPFSSSSAQVDTSHRTRSCFEHTAGKNEHSGVLSNDLSRFAAEDCGNKTKLNGQETHIHPSKLFSDTDNPLAWNHFPSSDESIDIDATIDISQGVDEETQASESEDDDLGFSWDRSRDEDDNETKENCDGDACVTQSNPQHSIRSTGTVTTPLPAGVSSVASSSDHERNLFRGDSFGCEKSGMRKQRHILYIQMQLCSQKTVSDFLASPEQRARTGGCKWNHVQHHNGIAAAAGGWDCSGSELPHTKIINIPHALQIFGQIAKGVKHVHKQGLIHRDLKPSNCFIDDVGVVKIGDFGLSRETTKNGIRNVSEYTLDEAVAALSKHPCSDASCSHTAGIGTRSYASPEQMSGSDYDASTDVYSLGIILFELCYPMYTGMERMLVLKDIHRRIFPKDWYNTIRSTMMPTVHDLIYGMLSPHAAERPTSEVVANVVDSQLAEFVFSLDIDSSSSKSERRGTLLLRVEAADSEGVLTRTINLIKEAVPNIDIVQYGLRVHSQKAIMEFALALPSKKEEVISDENRKLATAHGEISKKLSQSTEVQRVRQVATNVCPGRQDSDR